MYSNKDMDYGPVLNEMKWFGIRLICIQLLIILAASGMSTYT